MQIWTENLLFQQKFTVKKGRERLRSKRRANVKRQKLSTTSLNGKLTRPSEESEWLTKKCSKLRQKLRREIVRGEILTSLFKTSIKNLNLNDFQLHQASRWEDQAQRDKISLYGELELRNRLFQKDHVRGCQEIEELRRICCEETEQDKRELMNCLCIMRGILRP